MKFLAFIVSILAFEQLWLTSASPKFYLKLDHYENYENLLKIHSKCDSGRLCDPAFVIRVRGNWGESNSTSDCLKDVSQITFGDKIGSNLTNPLQIAEESGVHDVVIDIRVKDCHMGSPYEDIGDFYAELKNSDLPRPFMFHERVDLDDRERVRVIELRQSRLTPLSIKMRVSVWRQCNQFFYGPDCSKFCQPKPSYYGCHPVTGQSCSGSECSKLPDQPAQEQTAAAAAAATAAATFAAVPRQKDASIQPGVEKQKSNEDSMTLIAILSCLLALATVAAAAVLVIVRHRFGKPKKRPRVLNCALIPPTHSMAVGLRFEPDNADPPEFMNALNDYYGAQSRQLPTQQANGAAAAAAESIGRPVSEEYETVDEMIGGPLPPPLPARDNLPPPPTPPLPPMPLPGGQYIQRTPLSRSFSKSGQQ